MKRNHLTILALCLALCLCLMGCGGSSNDKSAAIYDNAVSATESTMDAGGEITSSSTLSALSDPNAKLIRTVYMDAQTKQYDAVVTALDEKIAALGGYIESREAYNGSQYNGYSGNRYCDLTIRVPAEQLDALVTHVNENCNVTNTRETVENITLQYTDTAARVEALETEQARLLELLEQAQTMEEILQIEERLNDVRAELSSYAAQLKVMENQVSYATIHLYIDEVEELTPVEEPTVWERISRGFSRSLRNVSEGAVDVFVWVVSNSPVLAVWAVVITGFALGLRAGKRRKAKKNKKEEVPSSQENPPE